MLVWLHASAFSPPACRRLPKPPARHIQRVLAQLELFDEQRDFVDMDGTVSTERAITVVADETTDDGAPVRIVCISDTHGFESSLGPLPDGDILIHAGDFWKDGRHADALIAHVQFDQWLAQQPHPIKIVVRGNHDPTNVKFPRSRALYFATEPLATRELLGLRFAFAPYPSRGVIRSLMPPCDVLVSHLPPKGILDECYGGQRVGSTVLRDAVGLLLAPPRLWVCGHIHESRGVARVRFEAGGVASGRLAVETTVVNAAMANTGIASHLVRGAASVLLEPTQRTRGQLAADLCGASIGQAARRLLAVFAYSEGPPCYALFAVEAEEGALLAHGALPQLNEFRASAGDATEGSSTCDERLYRHAVMEALQALDDAGESSDASAPLTHVIVGGDMAGLNSTALLHLEAETRAAGLQEVKGPAEEILADGAHVLQLRRASWQAALLKKRERASESAIQKATQRIAQQVVSDLGHVTGTTQTTQSPKQHSHRWQQGEAILVGYVALLQLGWLRREPAVRRSANGKLVQPGAPQAMHRKAARRQAQRP